VAAVLSSTSLGQRIVGRFFLDDDSAEMRLTAFGIFKYMDDYQFWYGASGQELTEQVEILGNIGIVENFWIMIIMSLGLYNFVIFALGFLAFLIRLARQGDRFSKIAVLIFITVASTSVSLASKSAGLLMLTALILCFGDYARHCSAVRASRSGDAPRGPNHGPPERPARHLRDR
jgi:hypothetical protein